MEILFNEKIARSYDSWSETPQGRAVYRLEGEVLLKLGGLAVGHRILEVGCGTGAHLKIFLEEGLNVAGVDISLPMLQVAKEKLGNYVQLFLCEAENLPFREKSFDCVTLITTLEFIPDPDRAVHEALRVSRGKILLGVLNKYSFLGMKRRVKDIFRPSIFNRARFYSIWDLKRLVAKVAPEALVDWASVLVLPMSAQPYFAALERRLSFCRNPLGAFLGMAVSMKEEGNRAKTRKEATE
jgi:ubiquinone/menaquinone biosynthesis C-methylase UbiE